MPSPPLGGNIFLDSAYASDPGAAALATGDFVVVWFYAYTEGDHMLENGMGGRLASFQGRVGDRFEVFHETDDPYGEQAECPAFAADGSGGVIVAYVRPRQVGVLQAADRFAPGLRKTQHFEVSAFIFDYMSCPAVAAAPDGRFVVDWSESSIATPSSPASSRYKIHAFGPDDQPLTAEPMTLGVISAYAGDPPTVGMDRTGRFVAVWRGASSGLMARRFAADATPIGSPFQIAASYASDPLISMAPEGDFAVAYTKPALAGKPQALVIRRFAADGRELGAPVSPGMVAELTSPRASTDRYGNFVLYWLEKGRTRAQVFNRSRAARGAAFDADPRDTAVALADSGRLLTAWPAGGTSPTAWSTGGDLRGRIWRGLKEDSYCVYRGNAFLCDAAVNGQEVPAAALGLGYPIDVPLLGDVDGDGRADACFARIVPDDGALLSCGLFNKTGGAPYAIVERPIFLQPGDLPVLGGLVN